MNILKTLEFDGKKYTLVPVGAKSKRAAQTLANDLRRKGYKARTVGNSKIGWFVYKR